MASERLTDLAHGGGCGCKLAPAVLQELLAGKAAAMPFAQLLVGTESSDDAAVWQVDERTCVIATTDFFMASRASSIAARIASVAATRPCRSTKAAATPVASTVATAGSLRREVASGPVT